MNSKRVQIEYDGRVWQCCHLSGKYGSGTGFAMKDYQYYVDKHGTEWNNINNKSLQEIFEHPYWNDLHDSFNNKTSDSVNPRIRRCAEKCGKGLDKPKSDNVHLKNHDDDALEGYVWRRGKKYKKEEPHDK